MLWGNLATKWMMVKKGIIVRALSYRGTDEEFLSQMVNMLLNIKLNETENYKLVFVFDLFGNVLLIPLSSYLLRQNKWEKHVRPNTAKE